MSWAQYNLADAMPAFIQATTSLKVDEKTLADAGRGQVEIPAGIPFPSTVDITQEPPLFT